MKKYIILVVGMLIAISAGYSQIVQTWTEDFDGNTISYTPTPASAWKVDTNYYYSSPNAIRGIVPNKVGDTVVFESPVYDFTDYASVSLRFKHICKISPMDMVRIEYRTNMGGGMGPWEVVPAPTYMGNALLYQTRGFSASSYPEWVANDSLALPNSSWWKDEIFDLSFETGANDAVQFRFVIQHGMVAGTQISYGWLIDNIEIIGAEYSLRIPTVEFISPFVKDTVYNSGPWEIRARVKTQTYASIETPWLKYTAMRNGILLANDSIMMTRLQRGDSLWKATIPSFTVGTEVTYSITGRDANGNYAVAVSSYVIARPESGYVTIGNNYSFSQVAPIDMWYNYSWSRQLYLGTELASGAPGGVITKLAWLHPRSDSWGWTYDNQSCYFQVVDDAFMSSGAYIDPLANGATLVWQGSISVTTSLIGWVEITLDQPFVLPPGKNLLIYWTDLAADYSYGNGFSYTITANNTAAYGSSDNSFLAATTIDYNLSKNRPDVRLYMERNYVPNSASVSTNMEDIIFVSSNSSIPVVADIKNQGLSDLDSIQVFYSINGATPIHKNLSLNPAVGFGIAIQDTLGYYNPKLEGSDTITIWISSPNGDVDAVTYDDTVTKIIYGSKDISMRFVDIPRDTVYFENPFDITAEIFAPSGASLGQVFLFTETTLGGVVTYDTLPMVGIPGDLWTVTIPGKPYGSQIDYSIKRMDMLGNDSTIRNSYFIKKIICTDNTANYIVIQDQTYTTAANQNYPFNPVSYGYSQSISLYTAEEIADNAVGLISKVSLRVSRAADGAFPIRVWLKTVPSSKTIWATSDNATWDVFTQDAILAYEGEFLFGQTGWVDIPLSAPLLYSDTNNLVVMFEQNCGSTSCTAAGYLTTTPQFYCSTTAANQFGYRTSSTTPPTSATFSRNASRPDLRIEVLSICPESNSVALVSINSPQPGGISGGISVPVEVTIRNRGALNLDSCTINWTRNGVLQTPFTYHGNLSNETNDTVIIGNYTSVARQWDTITVWVSSPNGEEDVLTNDDKLTVLSMGCVSNLSGTVTVGVGQDYSTLNLAIDAIRQCTMSGDLTLQLKGTFIENIDLNDINSFTNGYHLTFTSLGNDPDNAIIQPVSGIGIMLGNSDHITLQAITIDVTSGTYGVQFYAAASNITIRDCKLLSSPTATGTTSTLVYKAPNTGLADSIYIINNLFDGGYYGIYFYGITSTYYVSDIVFDSNTFTNQSNYGIYSSSIDFRSISYNTIQSRITGSAASWSGIYLNTCNGVLITGNRIIQRTSASLSSPTGMYFANFNINNPIDTTLVSNNEIILNTTGTYYGMNITSSRLRILHNSIYISGSGASRGINIANSATNYLEIKNNNIILQSTGAYPIYFSAAGNLNLYTIDYNNLYAPQYAGYYSSARTLAAWRQELGKDAHSVAIRPYFVDSSKHLQMSDYAGLECLKNPLVNVDIDNISRKEGSVSMGCYQGINPYQVNAALLEITENKEGLVFGTTDTIWVALQNIGLTTLSKATLKWTWNNQSMPDKVWTGSLLSESTIVIPLIATYTPAGNYTIKVWIDNLDQLTDQYPANDTVWTSGYICSGAFSGIYEIGNNNADFRTVNDFMNMAAICGIGGGVTLEIQPGIYNDSIDLTNSSLITGNYSLTITSTTHDSADVTIKSPAGKSAIILSQSNNIYIQDITIDVTEARQGIHLKDVCSNIVVERCNIYANPSATASSLSAATVLAASNGIFRQGTGSLDGLTVKHCTITGGAASVYLYGPTSSFPMTNIVIDSNTLSNQSTLGAHLYYAKDYSYSGNRITPRSNAATWYGLYVYYSSNGKVINNRVSVNNTNSATQLHGLWLKDIRFTQIANNEIYMNANATTTNGLYAASLRYVNVINNTIYTVKAGTTGTNTAFNCPAGYLLGGEDFSVVIKNNIFAAQGGANGTTYAFYFNGSAAEWTNNADLIKKNHIIDNNNYYSSGTNICYVAGSGRTNLTAWKAAIAPLDPNSVNIDIVPVFTNLALGLQLSDYTGMEVPVEPLAIVDIDNNIRGGITNMGCYQGFNYSVNATVRELLENKEALSAGATDSVRLLLGNAGSTTLTKAVIKWEWNNASQADKIWTGTLFPGETTVISLGKAVSSAAGEYTVKAWIDNLDLLMEDAPEDDTVFMSIYICSTPFSGTYTVGNNNANFTTVKDFIDKLALCGADGEVTLEIQSGVYNQSIDLSNITPLLGGNRLTITSVAHNVAAVTLVTNLIGVTLGNSNNIVLKDLTIDATAGIAAIKFVNGCTNVVIRDCRLLANPTSTPTYVSASAVISKENITGPDIAGIVDSIFIIHNELDGGFTGCHFDGGIGSNTDQYAHNLVFDSNTITNQSDRGVFFRFCDFISCSHNTVFSRTTNTKATWYGIYLYYVTGPIMSNRVMQRSTGITTPNGIFFGYTGEPRSGRTPHLAANNEIILQATASASSGITESYSYVKIFHNSVYISGTGAARGINLVNGASNNVVVQNNNIVMTSSAAYPIYMNSVLSYLQYFNLDYNNMFAPQYIGYAGEDIASMSQWQSIFTTDLHSVKVPLAYANEGVNMELLDYAGLYCPSYYEVGRDINEYLRTHGMTTMGAYSGIKPSLDLGIEKIVSASTIVTYPQVIPVGIVVMSLGRTDKVDSAVFGWSINGELQPSYTWTPSTPLAIGDDEEISIASINAGKSPVLDITVWIESVNGRKDSIVANDTARISINVLYTNNNLGIKSIIPLVPDGVSCIDDYTSLKAILANTSLSDHDFALNPVRMHVQLTQPDSLYLDTLISSGILQSGAQITIELTDTFPIIAAGRYDVKIWIDSLNPVVHDDTLLTYYVSGKFGLPVDEDFSNGMPVVFASKALNTTEKWEIISSDGDVQPVFGDSMLSFKGSIGSMTSLSTRQLDLSRTEEPLLSFWYFHDTIPCEDYTDVRISIDGGDNYNTLLSLTKYDAEYGWKQYNMNLPPYAINQCVILDFEAMEKSRSENVTQYIDRIIITARQDIAITGIVTPQLTVCDLENKNVRVVLSNLTDPVLNFAATSTTLTLEIKETNEIFTYTLDSGSLKGSSSDTITIATGIDFTKGTYTFKTYFSSLLDVDRSNDTLKTFIVINPALSVQVKQISGGNTDCLAGESPAWQEVTLINTGNMNLFNIDLILQVDTGNNNTAVYALFKEIYTATIHAGDTATHTFTNSYNVPWNVRYDVRTYAYLSCDSALVNSTNQITECVDITDLYIVSVDNPSGANDAVGATVNVAATLQNRADDYSFNSSNITVLVENSKREQIELLTENLPLIGISATVNHTFTNPYTVPNDSVYYLTVYTNSRDNYSSNDTVTVRRETNYVGIETLRGSDVFILGQNTPNPAKNRTRIDYSIPEAGEIIFHVHSVSGQLLYSQTIEAVNGKQSLELNTSTFAAGIYFYSIEYKGQRLVKRMMISE